nr:hypothetical protein [Tanacetum cinerariifolium]
IFVRDKMSRDVITVGSTMRIPLLYRGEYSQWHEQFMNYLEEQTDGEAMINSIKNADYPFLVVAQANDTAKCLWDALERQMRGSKYGKQDRKAAILYKYETFNATEGEQLLDTYLQKQDDVNDAMGYKKKAVVVISNPLALVAETTKVSKCKEKVVVQSESEGSDDEDITNKKPEYVKAEDKKADEKKRDMSKVKCYNCKKEGHFAKDCKKAKVKDYNYYKTKMLLVKKDSDEHVILAEGQASMESCSDSDQEINANIVFMAKIEKVLSDLVESSSFAEETIAEVSYYTPDSKSEYVYETSKYYDNSTNYGLFMNNDDDQEIFHDAIDFASENFNEKHIVSKIDHDKSEVDHNDSEDKDNLVDKLIKKFNQKIAKC